MFPAQLPSSAWLWVSQEASASVLCFALIQRQQHHSAAEFPAAAKEGVSWKVPKAFSAPRHHPLSHFHPVFFSFWLFFFFFLFFWEGSIWGCSLEGESNTTATDTSNSIEIEQRNEHGSVSVCHVPRGPGQAGALEAQLKLLRCCHHTPLTCLGHLPSAKGTS